jgi:NADH-quinone oxidoreductase subunit J
VILDIVLLCITVLAAIWSVMAKSLIKAAIGLASVSVMLSIIMFKLMSPLAAVFELSVCAGLITVVFITAISLTKPITTEALLEKTKGRLKKYMFLPIILGLVALLLIFKETGFNLLLPVDIVSDDVKSVLWSLRQTDIIGQIIIILTGVFGVVVLFKEFIKDGK